MGFKNNGFCTVWSNKETGTVVQLFEKYAEVTVSTSKKSQSPNAKNGYETDFNGRVRFIGRAFEKIRTMALAEKDRLKLLEVETTNYYDRAKGKLYTNHICWDFEPAESKATAPRQPEVVEYKKDDYKLTQEDMSDLPF